MSLQTPSSAFWPGLRPVDSPNPPMHSHPSCKACSISRRILLCTLENRDRKSPSYTAIQAKRLETARALRLPLQTNDPTLVQDTYTIHPLNATSTQPLKALLWSSSGHQLGSTAPDDTRRCTPILPVLHEDQTMLRVSANHLGWALLC